jgi:hypothetical protein
MNLLAIAAVPTLLAVQDPGAAPAAPAPAPRAAQATAPSAPAGNAAAAAAAEQLAKAPWFARLGMRSFGVEASLPVVDRVVLVPDEATFIAEIARWTPKERWPVLFEDDAFAPRFVRAFRPSEVLRREPVGGPAPDASTLPARCDAAIAAAWGGDPAKGSIAALQAAGMVPAGIVGTAAGDHAWTAALALAAGRGQPLGWFDGPPGGGPDDVLSAEAFASLDSTVRGAFAGSGLKWDALGDDLDAFTLCRAVPLRVDPSAPPGAGKGDPRIPRDPGPLSLTDSLCRNPDGSRYAFAAQVFGDRVRATSMAMCSLFLRRTEAWMFDGYAERAGPGFREYGFDAVVPALSGAGFSTRVWSGADGTMASWRSLLPKGLASDVLFLNSSGNCDYFEMEPKSLAPSTDIPVLRKPLALMMIHSFSLQQAGQPWTVGGRWLDHGVYSYVGSVHEPFLPAFIPPAGVVQRLSVLTPFLVAGRHWPGDPLAQPWRVATLGDPLMTMPAPKTLEALPGRMAPGPQPPGFDNVRAGARLALANSKTADAAAVPGLLAQATRGMLLCGDDVLVTQLWRYARSRGAESAAAAAAPALGAIFRAGTRAEFMDAWPLVKDPTGEQRDMLWQLWATDLPALTDAATVAVLKSALRGPRLDMDAKALLPAMRATEGRSAADLWVNDLIGRAADADTKRRLAELQAPG